MSKTLAGREAEAKDSMTYEGSYTGRKEQKALAWIAEVTGMPLRHTGAYQPYTLAEDLHSGVALCELANRLTHPRYEVPKQYDVCLRGHLKEDDLRKLRNGLYLTVGHKAGGGRGGRTAMESVTIVKRQTDRTRGDRTTLAVTLREGRNREIRRLVARLGYKVRRLKRTAIGPLKLKGLAIGQWRTLTHTEVKRLYKAAGLTGQRHR